MILKKIEKVLDRKNKFGKVVTSRVVFKKWGR
jgi:hypothetical protein